MAIEKDRPGLQREIVGCSNTELANPKGIDRLHRAATIITTIATVPQTAYMLRSRRIANYSDAEVMTAVGTVIDWIMDTSGKTAQQPGSNENTARSSFVTKYGFEKDNPHQAYFALLERVEEPTGNTKVKMTFGGTPVDPANKLSAAEAITSATNLYSALLFEAEFPLTVPFGPTDITVTHHQTDDRLKLSADRWERNQHAMTFFRTILANITPENWGKEEIILPATLDAVQPGASYEDTDDPLVKRDSAGLFDLRELRRKVDPLTLRGHHLPSMYNLIYFRRDPAERAAEETSSLKREKQLGSVQNATVHPDEYLGPTEETALAHEAKIRDVYRWYKHAPPDTSVTLTGDTPDSICATCYFSSHCTKGLSPSGDLSTKDSDVLDEWLQRLAEQRPDLLTNGSIRISLEQATFSDTPPRMIKVVKTTLGVLKSITFRLQNVR